MSIRSDYTSFKAGLTSWFTPAAVEAQPHDTVKGKLLRAWFIFSSAVTGFIDNNELLWAAALTYTVALSIVPILALAFSVLKGFGFSNELQPLIERYLTLGSSGTTDQLMKYINNVNAAAMGSLGGAFLLVTVISTLGTIEQAFNTIFRVPQSRTYLRKFTDYLSVLFTVPLFIVGALALTAVFSVKLVPLPWLSVLTPILFAWAGFFFLFIFFPYTRVRWRPALIGSFVTALLFQIAQYGYVHFQVGVGRYQAIYGALASLPVFLVWLYTAWIIILFGAELTAAVQRGVPAFIFETQSPDFPPATALYAMIRLAEHQLKGGKPISYEGLAMELHTGLQTVEPVIDGLKNAGLVVEDVSDKNASQRRIFLCRVPSAISVDQILATAAPDNNAHVGDPRIRKILDIVHNASREAVRPITLADVLSDGKSAS